MQLVYLFWEVGSAFWKIFPLEVCFLIIILIVVMQSSQESLKCSVIVYIHSIQLIVFGFPFKAPS